MEWIKAARKFHFTLKTLNMICILFFAAARFIRTVHRFSNRRYIILPIYMFVYIIIQYNKVFGVFFFIFFFAVAWTQGTHRSSVCEYLIFDIQAYKSVQILSVQANQNQPV